MAHSNRNCADPLFLTVPGVDGSGAGHWQTIWEAQDNAMRRVDLRDWSRPNRNQWVNRLSLAVQKASRPVILVAHSLGCLTVAWWARYERPEFAQPVIGALLVAPPDVEGAVADSRLGAFAPIPEEELPFPALVVGSRNDPFARFDVTRRMAQAWGATLIDAGDSGHINAYSGLRDWPFGKRLLGLLRDRARAIPLPSMPQRPAGLVSLPQGLVAS